MLRNSDVYKILKKLNVARVIPPIKKTNVILKNTNFQYAMKLWDYLQSHIAEDSKTIKFNKSYKDEGIRRSKFISMATGNIEDEYITGLLKDEWIK